MKLHSILTIVGCSIFFAACKSNAEKTGAASAQDSSSASAFEKYINLPEKLITEAQVAEICGHPTGAKFKVSKMKGSMAKYGTVKYEWPSDRKQTIKVGNGDMEVDRPYSLVVSLPSEVNDPADPVRSFNLSHRNITPEQAAKAKAAMDEAFKKRAEKEGLDASSQKIGRRLGDSLMDKATQRKFETVTGLGDAAFWEPTDRKLDILNGTLQITITADIADSDDDCKARAIQVAQLLLK